MTLACYGCGQPYDDPAWIEAVVPHDIWNNHLSPTGDEGGILCIVCMGKRAVAAGLSDVPVLLTAGPFVASVGEHAKRENSRSEVEARRAADAVPAEEQADAQPLVPSPSGGTSNA